MLKLIHIDKGNEPLYLMDKRDIMGEPNPSPDQRPNSEVEASRQKMIDVMNGLGKRRQELGILSLGTNPDDPNQRVDFFIAPIDTESGKSIEDGGSVDIVLATTEGFFAIRHSGTQDGRSSFSKLREDLLRMWGYWGNEPHGLDGPSDGKYTTEGDSFKFSKDPKHGYSLGFEVPLLYGGKNNYTEVGQHLGINFIAKIVPVGKDIVDRAFDASKEKARELKMPNAKSAMRSMDTNAAADSILGRLESS